MAREHVAADVDRGRRAARQTGHRQTAGTAHPRRPRGGDTAPPSRGRGPTSWPTHRSPTFPVIEHGPAGALQRKNLICSLVAVFSHAGTSSPPSFSAQATVPPPAQPRVESSVPTPKAPEPPPWLKPLRRDLAGRDRDRAVDVAAAAEEVEAPRRERIRRAHLVLDAVGAQRRCSLAAVVLAAVRVERHPTSSRLLATLQVSVDVSPFDRARLPLAQRTPGRAQSAVESTFRITSGEVS